MRSETQHIIKNLQKLHFQENLIKNVVTTTATKICLV